MFHVKQCIICDSYSLIPYISAVKDNSVTNEEFNILRCKNCNLLVTSPPPIKFPKELVSLGRTNSVRIASDSCAFLFSTFKNLT